MYKPLDKGPYYYARHAQDKYENLGFDYHGRILEKSVSNVIFHNKKNKKLLKFADNMLDYLVDAVKQIRLQYMFSHNKNDINVN